MGISQPTRAREDRESPASAALPADAFAAMQTVFEAHNESQGAFQRLVAAPAENRVRRELLRTYREKTDRLLQLLQQHNQSGLAPSPWNLVIVAQPLVQQTLIEADLADVLGEPVEATRLREWAFAIANRHLPPLALARIRRSIANQSAVEGRFNEALAEFDDIRRLFREAGDIVQAAQTTLEAVVVLEWLGDQERALAALAEARASVAALTGGELPITDQTSQALANELRSIVAGSGATGEADLAAALWRVSVEIVEHEGRVHKALGQHEAAAALFERVLPYYEAIGSGPAIEYQLAAIDRARGRSAEARRRLRRLEPAFAEGLLGGKVAGLRLLQAYISLGLDEPQQALSLAEQGLAELVTHPDDDLAWRLHWRKAQALVSLRRIDEALGAYSDAAAVVDSLRKSPLGYRLDSTALQSKLPLFEEAIALALTHGNGARCLHFIELVKSRALSSALSVPAKARNGRTDLETEFDQVTQRLDALEYQGFTGAVDGAAIRKERDALLARRVELMEQIRLRDPRWRGLTAPPPFDPCKLAAVLKRRNQAALTLHLRDGVVRSVLVVDSRFEVGQRTLDPAVLGALGAYATNLLRPKPDLHSLDPADLQLDATMFVPPGLWEQALAMNSLLVAPHGQLHLLPWASLPFGSRRLFERTPVGILPNLTCALALDNRVTARPRAALAGAMFYPGLSHLTALPYTGVELSALEALYSRRLLTRPLIDDAATESAVRALATRTDAQSAILHLSCHGTLSVKEPLGSGVLLRDGKIDAAEWAQMHLLYDEVVLSACSTGWRPMTAQGVALDGDDVLGLPGALLEAGARSIVVSIPRADDKATAAFMIAYHRRRVAGISPLAAFCHTQRDMLGSKHAPYTWSGLVCYAVH